MNIFRRKESYMMIEGLYSIHKAAEALGVSIVTVRRWCKSGKLESTRTEGNHRRFSCAEINRLVGKQNSKIVVGYARVSSHDQKADLVRQKERLEQMGCEYVITEVGSGLNCKKTGLKKLIKYIFTNKINTLILTHKDRLLRFG